MTPPSDDGENGADDTPVVAHYNQPNGYQGVEKSGTDPNSNPYLGHEYYKRKSGYIGGQYPGDEDTDGGEDTDNGERHGESDVYLIGLSLTYLIRVLRGVGMLSV